MADGKRAHVTYIVNDGGLEFAVRGNGDTIARARAEAAAKLKLTVATSVLKGSESTPIADATIAALASGTDFQAGADGDLTLELQNQAGPSVNFGKIVVVRMRGVTTAILLPGSNRVDVSHPLVTGFADVYVDGDGSLGYVAIGGSMNA